VPQAIPAMPDLKGRLQEVAPKNGSGEKMITKWISLLVVEQKIISKRSQSENCLKIIVFM
jgi:hypothetical protein